jgi:hypothetical protein
VVSFRTTQSRSSIRNPDLLRERQECGRLPRLTIQPLEPIQRGSRSGSRLAPESAPVLTRCEVGFGSAASAPVVPYLWCVVAPTSAKPPMEGGKSGIVLDASVQNCPPHKSSLHESCLAPTTRPRLLGRSSITSSGFEKNSSSFKDQWRKLNRSTLTERLREFQSNPLPTLATASWHR